MKQLFLNLYEESKNEFMAFVEIGAIASWLVLG